MWDHRELFYFFTWRDIKIKYKQTVLGLLWAVLQPLMLMVIFTLFFGNALNVPSGSLPYPVFVFSGLVIWNAFSSGLTGAANSMVSNAQIIRKVYFPRLIVPVSTALSAFFDFTIAFILFGLLLIFYRQPVSISAVIYWPLSVLLAFLATLGPGSLLAALNVKYRDFRYVIPFLIQLIFFVTPILYPFSVIKLPWLTYVAALSPMFAPIHLFRAPLLDEDVPIHLIVVSLTSLLLILITGILYFRKSEDYFADYA